MRTWLRNDSAKQVVVGSDPKSNQDSHGQRLTIKKLREAVCRVMDDEEEQMECNINTITCDTSYQSPVTKG